MRLGRFLGDHPHDALKHVLAKRPQGHAVEFGVYKGVTLRMIAEVMPVTGFDSFEGLPEDWRPGFSKGRFATTTIPQVPNADLVVGMFEDTIPDWTPPAPLGLVHLDADLYSSTATVLKYLEPHLQPGCWIVFDEFHGYDGCEQHEARAWEEFKSRTGMKTRVIGHGPEQLVVRVQ